MLYSLYCRFLFPLLLLASTILSSPSVPFYCRRFKGNCSRRRDYICCRAENIAATETVSDDKSDHSEKVIGVQKPKNITETESEFEDILIASPSIIEEVVVAPDEAPVSLKNTQFPSKFIFISGSS